MMTIDRKAPKGTVARPIHDFDVHALRRLSEIARSGRVPILAIAGPIFSRLRGDGVGREVAVEASKYLGPLGTAVAVALTGNHAIASDLEEYRAAIRALPLPALEALEDLLIDLNPSFDDVATMERARRMGGPEWTFKPIDGDLRVVVEIAGVDRMVDARSLN